MKWLLVFGLLVVAVSGEDKVVSIGKFEVKFKEKASKIQLLKDKTVVGQIVIDELIEMDKDQKHISEHTFRNFASSEPTFSDIKSEKKYGLDAKVITFTAKMLGSSELKLDVILFRENGTITNEADETFFISKGALKFSVSIDNWLFCGQTGADCKNTRPGKYLDLTIETRGKKALKDKLKKKLKASGKKGKDQKRDLETYDMGDEMEMTVSPLWRRDENWISMPSGYPKLELRGGKQMFTFRFEADDNEITKSFFFDPVCQEETSTASARGIQGSVVVVFLVAIIVKLFL